MHLHAVQDETDIKPHNYVMLWLRLSCTSLPPGNMATKAFNITYLHLICEDFNKKYGESLYLRAAWEAPTPAQQIIMSSDMYLHAVYMLITESHIVITLCYDYIFGADIPPWGCGCQGI